jgi:hypothetical protein
MALKEQIEIESEKIKRLANILSKYGFKVNIVMSNEKAIDCKFENEIISGETIISHNLIRFWLIKDPIKCSRCDIPENKLDVETLIKQIEFLWSNYWYSEFD